MAPVNATAPTATTDRRPAARPRADDSTASATAPSSTAPYDCMTHQPSSSPARAARACLVSGTPRRRGGRQGRRRPGPGRGEDGIRRHRHEDGGGADDEEGEHPPRRGPGAEPVERGRHGRGQGGRDDDDDGTGRLPRPQPQPVQADEHQHGSRWVTREVDRPVVGRVERDAGDVLPQQRPDVVDRACAGEVLRAVVEDAAQPAAGRRRGRAPPSRPPRPPTTGPAATATTRRSSAAGNPAHAVSATSATATGLLQPRRHAQSPSRGGAVPALTSTPVSAGTAMASTTRPTPTARPRPARTAVASVRRPRHAPKDALRRNGIRARERRSRPAVTPP